MKIPKEVLNQHTIVLGKTRSGKSTTVRGMVEYLLDHNLPVCIIDPKGDWWGLKSSADGKSAGYPVVIFGGNHSDVPINALAGAHVAELVSTGNRPCIIDLGGWTVHDRTRFFIDFASALFKHSRGQRWLAIDEVHNFCPKGKIMSPDAGMMLHWANRLASEGLGKGICIIAASQRPQKVHNDFLTSCETLIAMRATHSADRNAMKEWVDGCADGEKGKEVLASLAGLKRGQGWVWSPEIEFGPKIVDFPRFTTYDSFKAQTTEIEAKLKGWAEVDLEEVKTKLAVVVEQAKQNDPAELRRQIAALKAVRPQPTAPVVDRSAIDQARASGRHDGYRDAFQSVLGQLQPFFKSVDNLVALGQRCKEELHAALTKMELKAKNVIPVDAAPARRMTIATGPLPASLPAKVTQGKAPPPVLPESANEDLRGGELAILIACAQHQEGCTREQLSVLTGYKRSSRDQFIARLNAKDYLEWSQEPDRARPSPAGIAVLGSRYQPLPTGDALREYWIGRLSGGELRIFQILTANGAPTWTDRNSLDEPTGFKRSSRDQYLSRLALRQLIVSERGRVKASDLLFG